MTFGQSYQPGLSSHDIVFMQEGAPPHYATVVRNWLDRHFNDRWLGRSGPEELPARSPNLTPCDFFLWGHVKEEVYKNSPQTLDQLENSIRVVISDISRELLLKTCEYLRERLVKLRRNGGAHFGG